MNSNFPTPMTSAVVLVLLVGYFRSASSHCTYMPRSRVAAMTQRFGTLAVLRTKTTNSGTEKLLSAMPTCLRSSERNHFFVRLGNSYSDDSDNSGEEDEIYIPISIDSTDPQPQQTKRTAGTAQKQEPAYDFMDDLIPPPVNFARNSILFSENPSTKLRNNPPLKIWKFARTYLPAFVTGAWPWRDIETLDERPLAALYNALIVRLPVLGVAVSYLYQKIAEGHDLVIDLGFDANGPQAVPPVLVLAVLILILL